MDIHSCESGAILTFDPLQCVPHVDAEVLSVLVPKIIEILKTGVGLGTKVSWFPFHASRANSHSRLIGWDPFLNCYLSSHWPSAPLHSLILSFLNPLLCRCRLLSLWHHWCATAYKTSPHLQVKTSISKLHIAAIIVKHWVLVGGLIQWTLLLRYWFSLWLSQASSWVLCSLDCLIAVQVLGRPTPKPSATSSR